MMSNTETTVTELQDSDVVGADTAAETAAGADQQLTTAELEAIRARLAGLAAENEALKAENAQLQAEKTRLDDNWKRSEAEMQNLRRRTEREIAENAKYAISSFARDVIGIGDNLRRAIEAVPKHAAADDPALATLIEGVEVTERELFKVLERQNIVRFDPKGEKFDPHIHDAMMRVETADAAPDTILQVYQAGYMIGDRVLRAAAVVVAKAATGAPTGSGEPKPSAGDEGVAPAAAEGVSEPPETPPADSEAPQAASATIVRMQRRSSLESQRGARRAQIIRPVTVTTSVLSTKRPSSMTMPVMGGASEIEAPAPYVGLANGPDFDAD
ncbi:MAG: nucleotide exchange factor GrpE [Hyphomicrobiales bacterium]|nr:nucleotide exchange factor GrpE [Hyphomicrobiales bacterium]